jgi:hypothetical protein
MRLPLVAPFLLATLIACDGSQTGTSPDETGGVIQSVPQARATTITTSVTFPIDISVFIPCANGGAGETVELTGELHDLFHITLTSANTFVFRFLDNPQGITGVGDVSGDTYHGTGGTQQTQTGAVGTEQTFVNNFRIIGQRTGNNFLVHEELHFTVTANGTLTVNLDHLSVECR